MEPDHCRALNDAIEAGHVVDVTVKSIAADSLGAGRISEMAFYASQQEGVYSVLVPDPEITRARRALWDNYHLLVEYGAAAAIAGLGAPAHKFARRLRQTGRGAKPSRAYVPSPTETVVVVLCGGNTDPRDID